MANDGEQGFEAWSSGKFDLVLTDCQMPVMDGFQLTGKLRKIEKENGLERTPVVAITANALEGESERCLAAGMDDYISKPVELKALDRVLRVWL